MELQKKLVAVNNLYDSYRIRFPFEQWTSETREEVKNSITYHSTKIEGLTLNYSETIKFLKSGFVKKGARLKDLSDLVNHRQVLDKLFDGYDSLKLSEESIKQLHAELMKDVYQWDVVDPVVGGPGEYKHEINATLRPGNKVHEYLSPDKVKEAMARLLEKTNASMALSSVQTIETHPITISAIFHYEFLNVIHPFWDGNGRMARIITNLILLKKGFPPLVFPVSDKRLYINALIKSELDQERKPLIEYFFSMMIDLLSRRLKL